MYSHLAHFLLPPQVIIPTNLQAKQQEFSKGKPGLVEKDLRSSGSGDLQSGKKEVLTIFNQSRGKTKIHPSFTSLLQNNLFRETVFHFYNNTRNKRIEITEWNPHSNIILKKAKKIRRKKPTAETDRYHPVALMYRSNSRSISQD
jgi:hypothetical protein